MMGRRSELRVLKTTPLQPASKARATISALLDTGDDESRNGLLKFYSAKFNGQIDMFLGHDGSSYLSRYSLIARAATLPS